MPLCCFFLEIVLELSLQMTLFEFTMTEYLKTAQIQCNVDSTLGVMNAIEWLYIAFEFQ